MAPPVGISTGFAQHAEETFRMLSGAVRAMLSSLPDPTPRAIDVERVLKLDKRLAWQLSKLAHAEDLRDVIHVPARTSMERVIDCAERRRVPAAITEELARAFDAYEAFVTAHAGDRETLLTMVAGQSGSPDETLECRIREELHQGQMHVWGMRIEAMYDTAVYVPSASDPSSYDEIVICTLVGLQQLRDTGRAVHKFWISRSAKAGDALSAAKGTMPGFRMLAEFCSNPMPLMKQQWSDDEGRLETEFHLPGIGKTAAADLCYVLRFNDAVKVGGLPFQTNTLNTTPRGLICQEMLIPAGCSDPSTARFACYGNRYDPMSALRKLPEDLMPMSIAINYLGRGLRPHPDAPRHTQAVRSVLAELGQEAGGFDSYRAAVQYPVLHTSLSISVDNIVPRLPRKEQRPA